MRKLILSAALIVLIFSVGNAQSSDPDVKVTAVHEQSVPAGTDITVTYPTKDIKVKDQFDCNGKLKQTKTLVDVENGTGTVKIRIPDADESKTKTSADSDSNSKSSSKSSSEGNGMMIFGIIALFVLLILAALIFGIPHYRRRTQHNDWINNQTIDALGNNGGYIASVTPDGGRMTIQMNTPTAITQDLRRQNPPIAGAHPVPPPAAPVS